MASDPANAASGRSSAWRKRSVSPKRESVNTIALAAASAPPLETPTSAGSASGLRNSPCMIAPAAASRPPTIAAAAIRGTRIDHSTSWSRAVMAVLSPDRPSAAGRRERGMPAAPKLSATIAATASTAIRRGIANDADRRRELERRSVPRASVPIATLIAGNSPPTAPR
ncbi:hypothetical protein AB7M11_001118 [Bradyrhizobium ottawaense]